MSKRRGRWTYFQHPYNGPVWRLDGTTLDLEHDLQCHSVCIGGRCNGAWVLYEDGRYVEPVSEHLTAAMEWVEEDHGEKRAAGLAITSITHGELAAALQELAARTGNRDAYFPALATHIFEYAERQRTFAALAAI
jgi:hypothetical protein